MTLDDYAQFVLANIGSWKRMDMQEGGPEETLDDGQTRTFASGYHRDTATGKGDFALLGQAFYGLQEVAILFQQGAAKHGKANWLLGAPLSVYVDCMSRHAAKLAAGWTDENHASAVAWNALCMMHTRRLIKDGKLPEALDDLPKFDV